MIREYIVAVQERRLVSISQEIVINGLEPFTQYFITVAARTVATGNFSAPVQATTLEDGKHKLYMLVRDD